MVETCVLSCLEVCEVACQEACEIFRQDGVVESKDEVNDG